MPELPEVEAVRRSLAPRIVGHTVAAVHLFRPDVVRHNPDPRRDPSAALLGGQRIASIERHGKQLALVGDGRGAPAVCVHLGMSGSLVFHDAGEAPPGRAAPPEPGLPPHSHAVWCFGHGRLVFRDPRRFGGLWAFEGLGALRQARWDRLGPDALAITPAALHTRLSGTRRALKATLLDQGVLAGLGNIYVDELLFGVRLHPETPADRLGPRHAAALVRQMRRMLTRAVDQGGSTLRDYVDARGQPGGYQARHRVYGRHGRPCPRCRATLDRLLVAGRTTTCCPGCQGGP